MAEIKTEVQELVEGKTYTAQAGEYLITEKHTLADVTRFLVAQAGGSVEEIQYLLDEIAKETTNG